MKTIKIALIVALIVLLSSAAFGIPWYRLKPVVAKSSGRGGSRSSGPGTISGAPPPAATTTNCMFPATMPCTFGG